MKYRRAIESDIETIIQLQKESFPDEYPNISYQMSSKNYRIYVACDEEEIIGYVLYQVIDDEGEVYFFTVKNEYRGKKIGQNLLDFSLNELRKEKIKKVTLETRASNVVAQKIYEKSGFVNVSVRIRYYTDNQEDAIIYVWEDKTI
ncbi:MAG: ribosomal protein S18-alanine N-acetyltransferase [Acholeplasmataceae bacterium]|jgi:ribosomal-protein-alanine N-acetyltransferase